MTHTLLRWLTLLVFLLVSFATTSAIAAGDQTYTIKKGDTLWGISQKFIDDPYYWPNVWAKNPDITNPHLIFPGQKIQVLDGKLKIVPAYPEATQTAEKTTEEAASAPAKIVSINAGKSGNGFILTNEEPLGILVDSVDNRILLTKNDTVYLKMKNLSNVAIDDTFSLFSRSDVIKHPRTKKKIDPMMHNLGFVKVVEINEEIVVAKIGGAFREISRGAELYEFAPQESELALQRGTTDQKGYIIASREAKGTFSTNDVIFIDMGSAAGIAKGNLFYISRPRTTSDQVIKKAGAVQLPDAVLGAAIVIETKSNTASAIIIKSVDAAQIGDNISIVTN